MSDAIALETLSTDGDGQAGAVTPGRVQRVLDNAMGAAAKQKAFATQVAERMKQREARRPQYVMNEGERYVMRKLEHAKRTRLATLEAFEPVWTRSILYTAGVQHLRYISAQRQVVPEKNEDWKPTPVINIIQPKVQRVSDFFTRNRPNTAVVASTEERDDIEASLHGETLLKHLWESNREAEKMHDAANWLIITGNTFKRHLIDVSPHRAPMVPRQQIVKEPLIDESTGQPVVDPRTGYPVMTSRLMEPQDGAEGEHLPEVVTEIYGPMHETVPLAGECFPEVPWHMTVTMQPLSLMRTMYPGKADYIGEQGRVVTSDLYQHRILTLLTSGAHGVVRSLDPYVLEGYGIVYHYEELPTPEFPTGLTLVCLDDIPLVIDELPLRTRYSTEHCGYHKVPGRFWHRGMVEDLMPLQDQINKLEQFLQLNDAFNVNPMCLVPTQSNIPEGHMSNKPGLVVRYTYPFKPEFQDGVSMPPQVVQRRAMYMDEAEDISGVRHVIMGDAPSGVKSGVALNRLGEEAEGMFAPIQKMWERFIQRSCEAQLELAQRFYTTPRHISVQGGRGSLLQIEEFVGRMLRGNTRVNVEAGSYRPRSLAAKQEIALQLIGMGLLPGVMTDPEQHRRFLELMGLDQGFESDQSLDYKRAQMENELLRTSDKWTQVVRHSADDDMIHLYVHRMFRKQSQFLDLPNTVQMRYLIHENMHLTAVIEMGGAPTIEQVQSQDPEQITGGDEAPPDEQGEGGNQPSNDSGGGGPDA